MQVFLFLFGAILGRLTTWLFVSMPLAVLLSILPAVGLALQLLFC